MVCFNILSLHREILIFCLIADRSFMAGNPPPPAFAGYGGVPAPTGVGYDKEVQSFIQRTALNEEYEKKVELFLQRVGT